MTFFKTLLATILGFFVSLVLVTIILVMITGAFIAAVGSDDVYTIADKSLVRFELSGAIPEYSRGTLSGIFSSGRDLYFAEYLRGLERIKSDDRISGIHLKIGGFAGNWAQAAELRRKLEEVRSSGKFIIASSGVHGFDEKEYYVASAADSVILHPSAGLELNGIAASLVFFKPMLDRLGVKPEILRVGKFKSAVEPFLLDSASEENRAMTRALVVGIFSEFTSAIEKSRKISPAALQQMIDSTAIFSAEQARSARLIDAVLYDDQLEAVLLKMSGQGAKRRIDDIDLADYTMQEIDGENEMGEDQVALVYAVGTIVAGEGGSGAGPLSDGESIGSDTFAEAMKAARESDNVKAVVVRIDSPGGDASASEAMWREVVLTKEAKPVIVSMGGSAASGGYFIAAPADTIVAEPATLTGSIGVFALRFNADELMRERIGINNQTITSNPHADMMSMFRSPTELERRMLGARTDSIYALFLRIVAEGRGLSLDSTRNLAEGRVWTGRQAHANGLVDLLGGIEDAVTIAARSGGLKEGGYRLRILPRQKTMMEQFDEVFSSAAATLTGSIESRYYRELIERLESVSGIQALMPGVRID